MSEELFEVQDELKQNLQAINEQNHQLKRLCLYRENLCITADYHSLKKQIDHEEHLITTIREENKRFSHELSEQIKLIKMQKHEQWKLDRNRKDLLEKLQFNHEEITREKAARHELIRTGIQLKKDLKRKQKILCVHQQQITQLHVTIPFQTVPPSILSRTSYSTSNINVIIFLFIPSFFHLSMISKPPSIIKSMLVSNSALFIMI